jgi:hypothetical protein
VRSAGFQSTPERGLISRYLSVSLCLCGSFGTKLTTEAQRHGEIVKSALKVFFPEDLRVMRDVAGNDVGQRAHGEGIAAGDTCP